MKTISAEQFKQIHGEETYNALPTMGQKGKTMGVGSTIPNPTNVSSPKSFSQPQTPKSGGFLDTYTKFGQGIINNVGQDIKTRGENVYNIVTGQGDNANKSLGQRGTEAFNQGIGAFVSIPYSDIPKAAGDALGNTKTLQNFVNNHPETSKGHSTQDYIDLAKRGTEIMPYTVQKWGEYNYDIGKAISDSLQKDPNSLYSRGFKWLVEKDPGYIASAYEDGLQRLAETGQAAGGIAGTILLANQAAQTGDKVLNDIKQDIQTGKAFTKKTYEKVQETTSNIKNKVNQFENKVKELNPFRSKTNLTPEENQAELDKIEEAWRKPSEINKPGYGKTKAVLEKDPNAPKTLARLKVDAQENTENGRFATKEVADKIRKDAGQMSKDIVRPALEKADAENPINISVKSLKPRIDSYRLTADDAESVQGQIDSKNAALYRKYPNGMNRTQMFDERIKYDQNAGYQPFKSNADNNAAIANRAMSAELNGQIDASVPKGLPYHEFQKELSSYYRAADYAESLDGKVAPATPGQTVARLGAKYIGATVGTAAGGGPIGGFVGYQTGKELITSYENMSNAARVEFMANLKVSNPPMHQQMLDYINKSPLSTAPINNTTASAVSNTSNMPTSVSQGTGQTAPYTPKSYTKAQIDSSMKLVKGGNEAEYIDMTKTNIARGMESMGFKEEAKIVSSIDTSKVTTLDALNNKINNNLTGALTNDYYEGYGKPVMLDVSKIKYPGKQTPGLDKFTTEATQKGVVPPGTGNEASPELVNYIKQNGNTSLLPIKIDSTGKIIDGVNRYDGTIAAGKNKIQVIIKK